MEAKFNVKPTTSHYNCVLDALTRMEKLDQAEQLITQMSKPDVISWKTLLAGARWTRNVVCAENAFKQARVLDPNDTSLFIMLSNVYAAARHWSDRDRIRQEMEALGLKKIPGKTWIEVDGKLHSFVYKDNSHPKSAEISAYWENLKAVLKTSGYQPDTSYVLKNLVEEEKEDSICSHR